MDILHRIRDSCREISSCYMFLMVVLITMLGLISAINVYFLIDRRNEIWEKTFYRIGLLAGQQFFFMWRVCAIRKLQGSLYDTFAWILFTYFPIVVSDTLMEGFLYLKLGKDTSYKSKTESNKFPGSQQTMISSYFQLYIYSFLLTFFAEIAFIVYRVMSCRAGGGSAMLSEEQQREEIEDKLETNRMAYTVQELHEKECSICQTQMFQNEEIIKLQCRHMFHKECIFQWLLRTNRQFGYLKCPNCRNDLIE